MAIITFAPDTAGFGSPGYQVPVVVSPTEHEIVSKTSSPKKKLNHKLGYVITDYRDRTDDYKIEHEQQYKKARKILFEKNRPLALSYANHYKGRGIPLDDLIQGMEIALFDCTANIDPAKGELATLAESYFFQAYMTLLHEKNDRAFHIPNYMFDMRERVREIKTNLEETLDKVPTEEEIAREYNRIYPPRKKQSPINHKHIKGIFDYERETEPMIKKNANGKNFENQRALTRDEKNPLEENILSEDLQNINKLISKDVLDEREIQVLVLSYGLNDCPSYNNVQIGKMLGYSREMIRRIHNEAITKLKTAMDPKTAAA